MYKDLTINEARKILEGLKVYTLGVKDTKDVMIPGYKVIRRQADDSEVKILTNKYFISQHIDMFDQTVKQLDDYGLNYEVKSIGVNDKGCRHGVDVTFLFPELSFDIDGSMTNATLELINSNDGNQNIIRVFGAYRMRCSNGMVIGETLLEEKRKHYGDGYELEPINEALDELQGQFTDFSKMIEMSRNVKIDKRIERALIRIGFPRLMVERLPTMTEKYLSVQEEDIKDWTQLWSVYQALTNWISNVTVGRNLQRAAKLQLGLYDLMKNEVKASRY